MALKSCAAELCAAVIMAMALCVPPADAAERRQQRYDAQQRYAAPPRLVQRGRQYSGESLSLDGRNTGQPRTCGFEYFQYDYRGATVGPYCH
jgi:hypothetical protein